MALQLNVPSMACADCAQTITKAIATVDPGLKVDVDLASKTVHVEPKEPNTAVASEESIIQAITASGYPVEQ